MEMVVPPSNDRVSLQLQVSSEATKPSPVKSHSESRAMHYVFLGFSLCFSSLIMFRIPSPGDREVHSVRVLSSQLI